MSSQFADWFFMRHGFESFRLEPKKHMQLLIGERDREHRDWILRGLREAQLGGEGFKAVIYGDFGRGKTHQCRNLIHEVSNRDLPILPVYVVCTEYRSKEAFSSLFQQMIEGLGWSEVRRVALAYLEDLKKGDARSFLEVTESEDLAAAFDAMGYHSEDSARAAHRWLGGVQDIDPEDRRTILKTLPKSLTVSRDYAAVMRGFTEMFRHVDGKSIVFFVDEAERFNQITHVDTYWSWVASLRALTEILEVGFMFFAGAKTRDDIPAILVWDEIATRIGTANYRDLLNPGREELRAWVLELFQTIIRKGEVPEPLRDAVAPEALDPEIPDELQSLVDGGQPLEAYPFTPEALDTFVDRCVSEELANKPREMLIRIQRAAARSLVAEKRQIDEATLDETQGDGF